MRVRSNRHAGTAKRPGNPHRWLVSAAVGVLLGFSALGVGTAHADPADTGSTTTTSTPGELADMVMDVIEHGGVGTPTPTELGPPQ
jgi:hypothetical protein